MLKLTINATGQLVTFLRGNNNQYINHNLGKSPPLLLVTCGDHIDLFPSY